jgi:hypothetical protein
MSSRLIYAALFLPLFSAAVQGGETPGRVLTKCDLVGLDLGQLDALFAAGTADAMPTGLGRGTILMRTDGKKLRLKMEGLVWKGKSFGCDGRYVNQWAGFRAVRGFVALGPSWYDGRPCVVVDHEPGTPIFGNARDELRQISPGLWLGRFYQKCPCGKLEGYFVLEFGCCR